MNKTMFFLIIAVLIIAIRFYLKGPSGGSVVRKMSINIEKGKIEYKGVSYSIELSDRKIHVGDIRYIGRAYDKNAPYITNDAVVTTGEFSDPSIVKVTPIKNGNMSWRSQKQPKGSLIVLHFIPTNLEVYKNLKQIKKGQRAEFIGREEVDSKIKGSDNSFIALGHSNHKFFILEKVRQIDKDT